MFFSDPEPLFDEMGDASVLITPHRYAPEYAAPGDQRHLQRPVPAVPPGRARAGRAELVARPLHRVVLLPARGRQARRPEVPRRLAGALRGRARAPALRRRPRAVEHHAVRRPPRAGRRRVGRRRPARLLPLPPRSSCASAAGTRGSRRATRSRVEQRELVYDPYLAELDGRPDGACARRPASTPGSCRRRRCASGCRTLARTWARGPSTRFPFLLRVRHPLAGR